MVVCPCVFGTNVMAVEACEGELLTEKAETKGPGTRHPWSYLPRPASSSVVSPPRVSRTFQNSAAGWEPSSENMTLWEIIHTAAGFKPRLHTVHAFLGRKMESHRRLAFGYAGNTGSTRPLSWEQEGQALSRGLDVGCKCSVFPNKPQALVSS